MKIIISILLFIPSLLKAQPGANSWVMGCGEYVNLLLNETTHRAYDNTTAFPTLITERDSVWIAAGGAHHGCIIAGKDSSAYCKYDNVAGELGLGNTTGTSVFTKITQDSTGLPFVGVQQIICAGTNFSPFWATACIRRDSVYVWGNTQGGNLGNATWGTAGSTRPVYVPIPGSRRAKKIQAGVGIVVLCTDGTVWTWGANGDTYALSRGSSPSPSYQSPGQVTLPGGTTALDIAGNGGFWFILLSNGHLLACGIYGDYLGINTGPVQMTPQDVTSALNLPATISQIAVNNACTYVILTDGSLWSWGSNAMGTIGNGIEPDYSNYGLPPLYGASKFPYANDQGLHELMEVHPVHVMPGISNFTQIWTNAALTWQVGVKTADNYLIAWGRNKGGALPNSVTGANPVNGGIASTYPNSWDVPYPTRMFPDSVLLFGGVTQVTSPYCVLNPSGTPCNTYSNPSATSPMTGVGPNQRLAFGTTSTTLQGFSTAASTYRVTYHIWTITVLSGTMTPVLTLDSDLNPILTGLSKGIVQCTLTTKDQNWRTSTASMTVSIGQGISIPAGSRIILQ